MVIISQSQLKSVIISLIKDHLLYTRFFNGMEDLGFYSDNYQLNLADSIFKLIGIKAGEDELFEKYLEWCSQIGKKDIFDNKEALHEYAEKIYKMLSGEVSGNEKE